MGSCVQALDLGATVHISGLCAGSDVVTGTLLADTDSPLLHCQECVHRIHRSCQEAKYLQNTGTVSPRTHQPPTGCLGRTCPQQLTLTRALPTMPRPTDLWLSD